MWKPNDVKDYHPICKTFFERELSEELAIDIAAELTKQREMYDPYTPIFAADECLRADLLECLSYVVAQLGLSRQFVLNELKWE